MKDTIKFSDVCVFPSNIADVTSISMECNYECDEDKISGDFLIEGTYRAYELSINQDNFSYKLPFEYKFSSKVDEDSATVEIEDFTYEVDNKELKVDIEYSVSADSIPEPEEIEVDEDFDRFIIDNDVELVDLSDNDTDAIETEVQEEKHKAELEESEPVESESREENIVTEESSIENRIEENVSDEETKEEDTKITNTIINNIRTTEDEYITYRIYICTASDTLESISNKFKISVDVLKSYNDVEKITAGVKLIIPGIDE